MNPWGFGDNTSVRAYASVKLLPSHSIEGVKFCISPSSFLAQRIAKTVKLIRMQASKTVPN